MTNLTSLGSENWSVGSEAVALAEDQGLISSTLMVPHNYLYLQSQGI